MFISLGLCGCNTTLDNLSLTVKNSNLTQKLEGNTDDDLYNSVVLDYDVDNMIVTLKLQSGEIKDYKLGYPLVGVIGYDVLDKDTLSKLYVYLYNAGYTSNIAIVYWNENTKELIFYYELRSSYSEGFSGKETIVFDGEKFNKIK